MMGPGRGIERILGGAGLLLLLVGVGLIARPGARGSNAGPVIEVVPSTLDVGTLAVGAKERVEFTLVNRSGRPVEVVGSQPYCNGVVCLTLSDPDQRRLIPPSGESRIGVEVSVSDQGRIDASMRLFITGVDGAMLRLAVSGNSEEVEAPW